MKLGVLLFLAFIGFMLGGPIGLIIGVVLGVAAAK